MPERPPEPPRRPRQLDLFLDAQAARDDALGRVEANADSEWLALAAAAIERAARKLPEFISDDVWEQGLDVPRESRALGAAFQAAARAGLIVRTDRMRASVRSHLSPKPVWRSLIYQQP